MDLNEDTSLTHLLDRHDTEDDENVETQIIKHSPFYGQAKFADLIRKSAALSILDLNIQNIFSKFDELVCFIQTTNIKNPISAICLNECWISQEHDVAGLHLEGYTMFFQRGNRVGHGHCGLSHIFMNRFLAKKLPLKTSIPPEIIYVSNYHTLLQIPENIYYAMSTDYPVTFLKT